MLQPDPPQSVTEKKPVSIKPHEIGFDIDGVVADTCEAFLRIARNSYNLTGFTPEDITEFEVSECLPVPKKIVEAIFDQLLHDPITADMPPMQHAVSVLNRMAQHGPITMITARPRREPIDQWLRHVLPSPTYSQTRLIAMGDHDGKASHIKNAKISYFVDDRAETCLALEREGIVPLVFSHPWNRGKHNLNTVDNWYAIEEKLSFTAENPIEKS